MRIRAVFVLFLIVLGFSFGCRNALSPTADRNRPPETWITGAPQDTVTVKDKNGKVIGQPNPGTIPTRFHINWAGSDIDGAVVGFYWAVVETLPIAAAGTGSDLPPPLPGPRANQYRFTTKTDSTFDFNVSEFFTDRQHAFFIFAVDDKGRSDPTPARFIFFALDKYPALPVLELAQGAGHVVRLAAHGVPYRKDTTVVLRDSFEVNRSSQPPRDTIPSGARIDFRWHGEPRINGGVVTRYKYKLDEPFFVEVDSSVTSVSYNTGIASDAVAPGTKVFTLRTIDLAGGADNVTRRFQINYSPDTWFAGPDPRLVPVVNDPTDPIDTGHRYVKIQSLSQIPSGRSSMLSCDSLYYWPSERQPRKTFWEWYKDKLFLRSENDTVNMNSWVILQAGGADRDSRYNIDSRPSHHPDTSACFGEPARVLHPGVPNGSPVGFRYQYAHGLDPRSVLTSVPSQSSLFPVFDAAVPFEQPTVNAYKVFTQSGKVYMTMRAEDGDGAVDDRLPDMLGARLMTDDVDSRTNPDTDPLHVALRRQLMLTFFVNRAPYFDYGHPAFVPKPPEYNGGAVATIDTTRILTLSLKSLDPDPFDPATRTTAVPGGPSAPEDTVLRTQVTIRGSYTVGAVTRDTTYTAERHFSVKQPYFIDLKDKAPYITGTHLTLTIELCDCADCEDAPGTGRCIFSQPIPVDVVPGGGAPPGRGSMFRPTGTQTQEASGRSSSQ